MPRGSVVAVVALLLTSALASTAARADTPVDAVVDVSCVAPPPPVDAALSDDGRTVGLDVLVQLDRTGDLPRAKVILDRLADGFAALDIEVRPRFERADYATLEPQYLLEEAAERARLRPDLAGVDAVLVLTGVDVGGVAGMASCIGAVRDGARGGAVAVAEIGYRGPAFGTFVGGVSVRTSGLATSVLVAHELGHLLGALHEHGTCANPPRDRGNGVELCSVMSPYDFASSMRWNAVEATTIRANALTYLDD